MVGVRSEPTSELSQICRAYLYIDLLHLCSLARSTTLLLSTPQSNSSFSGSRSNIPDLSMTFRVASAMYKTRVLYMKNRMRTYQKLKVNAKLSDAVSSVNFSPSHAIVLEITCPNVSENLYTKSIRPTVLFTTMYKEILTSKRAASPGIFTLPLD